MKFLNNVDLDQNETLRQVLQQSASVPSTPSPIKGQIYYNSTTNRVYAFNGTEWKELTNNNQNSSKTTSKNFTSATLASYYSWTTESVPAGRYKFEWYFLWQQSQANTNVIFQIQIDGNIVTDNTLRNTVAATTRTPVSGFRYQTFATDSTHTINLLAARSNGTLTVYECHFDITGYN